MWKAWRKQNKKTVCIIVALLLAFLVGAVMWMHEAVTTGEEVIYKETKVAYGPLTVGVTEEGTVTVGTVEQSFDLDISEYAGGSGEFSFRGPRFNMQSGNGNRKLEVEEVYITEGRQVKKGDALFKLTEESVQEIRKELVSDEEDAGLAYDNLLVQQKKSTQEASQVYEENRVYGNAASLEYEEALYELEQAAEEALEKLEDAQEDLEEYREDLAEVQENYTEAKHYLEESSAAADEEKDTYWRLKNEELREQAKKTVDDNEDEIEKLEDTIAEKELEIISLQAEYTEAVMAYQSGEADARTQYDKRIFHLNHAAEIYSIATDEIEYQAKVAREDYEDASSKLQAFDEYIIDGVVVAQYEGVVTGVSIAEGDTVQNDTAIATLNNYEDITISVNVDDDDMDEIAVGDTVNLFFTAFPEGSFTGKVSDIGDATIDANSDITYTVEIAVGGDVEGLYEGMTGEVTFITKETKEVTYVSNRAILREGTKSYVKVKDAEGRIQKIEVVTGFSDGNNVEIKKGLSQGDVVLIESKVKSK